MYSMHCRQLMVGEEMIRLRSLANLMGTTPG